MSSCGVNFVPSCTEDMRTWRMGSADPNPHRSPHNASSNPPVPDGFAQERHFFVGDKLRWLFVQSQKALQDY